ncbi:MAG: hypothetical protein P1U67_01750 [Alcanivoracaceae bacterium]|nr:hypothetical protein [Alcanivoracaceae bacterium]
MRLSRKWCLAGFIGLLSGVAGSADDDYAAWRAQQKADFSGYLSAQDQAFVGYLEGQWTSFKAYSGVVRDTAPKPVHMPIAPDVAPPSLPVIPVKPAPTPEPQPKPVITKPPAVKPPPKPSPLPPSATPSVPSIQLSFYGVQVSLPQVNGLSQIAFSRRSSKSVADFWKAAAPLPVEPLLQAIELRGQQSGYNDWALMQLVRSYAAEVFPNNQDKQVLLQWFLLTRLGYRCKVGFSEDRMHLYLPTGQMVYEAQYLKIDNQRYFIDLLAPGAAVPNLTTYEGAYPGANKLLELRNDHTQMDSGKWRERKLTFEFRGKPYALTAHYDANKIEFLASYPQTDFEFYFDSQPSQRTANELLDQLRPIVEKLPQDEAVNFLLRFAQKAFDYKTDGEGFGYENYLLIEETLHYPYSDCEDRAVLFAWLARNLVDVPVIGLLYPGHVATAVLLEAPLPSARIEYRGQIYNVADPTYIGADAGMVMPQYEKVAPTAIPVML